LSTRPLRQISNRLYLYRRHMPHRDLPLSVPRVRLLTPLSCLRPRHESTERVGAPHRHRASASRTRPCRCPRARSAWQLTSLSHGDTTHHTAI